MGSAADVSVAERTQSRLMELVRGAGAISRVELAERSGLTAAMVSIVMKRAIADGWIVETGQSASTGGRRRTLLAINSDALTSLGMSLDHERLVFVASDLAGKVIGRLTTGGTGDVEPDVVVQNIVRQVRSFVSQLGIVLSAVAGLGIASPGSLHDSDGRLLGLHPSGAWDGFPLGPRLSELLDLPVIVESEASCAAVGQHWMSRSESPSGVTATIYMADRISAGIFVDGKLYRGASSNAGQLGHVTLDPNGPRCPCGRRGCVDMYAAPANIVKAARLVPGLSHRLALDGAPDRDRANYQRIAKAATAGDQECRAVLQGAAGAMASGLVSLTNVLDLDQIFLSGPGYADAGSIFALEIRRQIDAEAATRGIHPIGVSMAHSGTEAAAVGAAALILQNQVTPHTSAATPF